MCFVDPEIASFSFASQRPVCFGTAKVLTFFASAIFILNLFNVNLKQPVSLFAGCKGTHSFGFCKLFLIKMRCVVITLCKSAGKNLIGTWLIDHGWIVSHLSI